MEFINDKVTVSFNKLKEYLNIEINQELITSLIHSDYIIDLKKGKYVCKIKYSKERIEKAKEKRSEKKVKKNNIFKKEDNKEVQLDSSTDDKDPIIDMHVISSEKIKLNKPQELSPDKNKVQQIIENTQTARSDSYLFNEIDKCNSPIDNKDLSQDTEIKNKSQSKISEDLIFIEDGEIPDELMDIYEKVELQEDMIDSFIDDIKTLEFKLEDKEFRINDLKQFIIKYKKSFTDIKTIKSDLLMIVNNIIENNTTVITKIIEYNKYLDGALNKNTLDIIYIDKRDLENTINLKSNDLNNLKDTLMNNLNKLQKIIDKNTE